MASDNLSVDPDVDLHDQRQRRELHPAVLALIAAGGAVGSSARYGLGVAFPAAAGGFPWATFGINVTGCLLLGLLMTLIAERYPRQRLIRPFLGVGVLGGYTTFSTYVVDFQRLGAGATGLLYLAGTLVAAVLATTAGLAVGRRRWRRA